MGTEVLVGLALAAVASGAEYVNQRNVAKRQDSLLAQQIRDQGALQKKANARTTDLINQLSQDTSAQDKAKSQAQIGETLAKNQPTALAPIASPAAASAAYKKAGSDAALGITDWGKTLSDLSSSIAAPTMQRQREAIDYLDPYKTDVGFLGRQSRGSSFLSDLALRGVRPSAGLSLLSGLAGAGSKAMLGGGMGAGASAADAASGVPFASPTLVSDLPNPWAGYAIGTVPGRAPFTPLLNNG